MKAIEFPEANEILAKDQPEYVPLPVFIEYKDVPVLNKETRTEEIRKIPWTMTACFEFSDEEITELIETRRLFHTQCVFGNLFQPIVMSVQNPFIQTEQTT
jgi:hypothetical protein